MPPIYNELEAVKNICKTFQAGIFFPPNQEKEQKHQYQSSENIRGAIHASLSRVFVGSADIKMGQCTETCSLMEDKEGM